MCIDTPTAGVHNPTHPGTHYMYVLTHYSSGSMALQFRWVSMQLLHLVARENLNATVSCADHCDAVCEPQARCAIPLTFQERTIERAG